jgi:pentose-5-phosphate-3-epimerase
MSIIIPAILTNSKQEFRDYLSRIKPLAKIIQVDVMDGEFVESKSLMPREFFYEDFADLQVELHIMANFNNTRDIIESVKSFKPCTRIIVHQEICTNLEQLRQLVNQIKSINKEVAIVINPDTDIRDIGKVVKKIDGVQFMGVNPGFYGSTLQTQVYAKVKDFINRYTMYAGDIAWDGAVSLDNIDHIQSLGVTRIAVGSAIFKSDNPAQSYKDLVKRLQN